MNNLKSFLKILSLNLLFSLFIPSTAYSVDIRTSYPIAKKGQDLAYYINPVLRASMIIAGVITFILIVAGGLGMIISAGNPQQQEKGKNAVTAGVMGLALVISAYWIIQILQVFLNINLLNPPI